MPPEMSAPELSASISKGKILVVDDELDIREGLETLLSLEGYSVELAVNGVRGRAQNRVPLLRSGAARSDDAGPVRHGRAARRSPARPRNAHLHDHGLRLGGSRRGCAQTGRQRLFLQALGQREAADRDRPHDLQAAPRIRKYPPQAGAETALQFPQHHRQERPHAAPARPGGAGGDQPLHHPDHRRNRHRQRADRQSHPRQFAARRPDVRAGQQRLAPGRPARIHAVRPREGRLHQRHPDQEGLFRGRQPRHHFLR